MTGAVDQAEALLAVLGMRPIISHAIEDITEQQWRHVLSIEDDVDAAARTLVRGKSKPVPDVDAVNYLPTLRDLSTPYQARQVEAMLSKLPTWFSDSSGPFLILSQRAFTFLGTHLPRQAKVALTGIENLPKVPTRLLDRFMSLFEVLDDPLRTLALAGNAQLLGPQLEALDFVFPSLTGYMRDAVKREIIAASAEVVKMPYHAEQGAEKLLGKDLTSPVLRKILSTPSAPKAPTQDQKQVQPGGAKLPTEQMTRVQRTDNLGAE